jgi:4-aminobutyrate aminotransferase-like enzyme
MIGCAQGRGLFWGLDLVRDARSREPVSRAELRHITTLLMQEGILTGTSGRFGNILKIRPPLVFSRENADQALDALERVFGRL